MTDSTERSTRARLAAQVAAQLNEGGTPRQRQGDPYAIVPPETRLVAVVGPTAAGKTEVAVSLAQQIGGEIVNIDSRQMVRHLDIGTAKPTPDERARARHHLIDITDPGSPLTLADVQRQAYQAIARISERERVPILVGGTGQYLWAVLEGWEVPGVAPDPDLRERLTGIADREGVEALHRRLAKVDPASAEDIHPNNVRRVVRALEIFEHTGRPKSEVEARRGPPCPVFIIGIDRPDDALDRRIDRRIDAMLAYGLEAEVRGLVDRGFGFELPAMSSVGYSEWEEFLEGSASREDVVAAIRSNTRRLARQQRLWFRRDDPRIRWFDPAEESGSIQEITRAFVRGKEEGTMMPGRPDAPSGHEPGAAGGADASPSDDGSQTAEDPSDEEVGS